MSAGVFVNAGQLIKSIPVSPMVYLLAQILDNLVNFIATLVLILAIGALIDGGELTPWLLLPVPLIPLIIGVFAMAWCFATAQVFFRDTRFLLSFGLQAAFFLTPIFYPRDFVPADLQWMITINPFFQLISPFQVLIHNFSWASFQSAMAASLLTSLIMLTVAGLIWRRRQHSVYLHV
jgi:ABC-type polysaccharide/polyol phosphate export permease